MLATLIQRYDKKLFHFKNERLTEILQAVRCHIVLIPYINLLNLSWIINAYCLRNMVPLTLLLLNTTFPVLANSVDPDQLASEEAN